MILPPTPGAAAGLPGRPAAEPASDAPALGASWPAAPLGPRALLAVALAVAAGAFLASLTGLRDPDMFHHLALGRDIVARRGFAHEDPFLFPLAGTPAGAMPYWLGSVLVFLSQRVIGDAGPVWLAGFVGAAVFLVLLLDALDRRPVTPVRLAAALAPLALALAVFRFRAVPRPEIFAILFVVLTAWAVRRHARGDGRPLLFFPLLALLWTNVHPSAVAGVGLVALHAVAGLGRLAWARLARRSAGGGPSPRSVALAGAVAAVGLLATFASPSRLNPALLAIRFALTPLGLAQLVPGAPPVSQHLLELFKHYVLELQPLPAGWWRQHFGILLWLAVGSTAVNWRRASPAETAALAVFAAMAVPALRHSALAAAVAAPIAARNLGDVLERLEARIPARQRPFLAGAAALAAAASLVPAVTSPVPFGTGFDRAAFPVRAVDYLQESGVRGRLFDTFQFGGYLEWRVGSGIYQDGRGLLVPGEEEAALQGPSRFESFAALDARYRFDALVVQVVRPQAGLEAISARSRPGVDLAADRSTWALVAFDDGGLLYLRRGGRYARLVERDEFRFAMPGTPLLEETMDDPAWRAGFVADMERAVAAAPGCATCRVALGLGYLSGGRAADALRATAPVLEEQPRDRWALEVLGRAAAATGDERAALGYFRRAAATGIEPADPRRLAARLLYQARRLREAERLVEANLAGSPGSVPDLQLAAAIALARGDSARAESLRRAWAGAGDLARAKALADEAMVLAQRGDVDGAIRGYRASIAIRDDAAVRSNLGYLYLDRGFTEVALAEQRRAVAMDPSLAAAHYGIGLALRATGDRAGAVSAFREYLRLEPRGAYSLRAEELIRELERR